MTSNDNPSFASAFGPLVGGRLYGGRIDAYGEEDWFYFYTAGAGAFDIALTNVPDTEAATKIVLYDGEEQTLSSTDVSPQPESATSPTPPPAPPGSRCG